MNRIKQLREEKGISMREVAKNIGIPYTTYVNYEKNEREPNSEMLITIANYFNVSIDYLLCRSDDRLSMESAFDIFSIPGILPPPTTVKKPRLGKISCGEPLMTEENFDGYDDVPADIKCDFTLVCKGDSMIGARIHDGDLVYIRQQPTVETGQIAAVLIDGTEEKLLKRVYIKEKSIILQAENPSYEPLFFHENEMNKVRILGRAVGFTSVIH